MALDVKDVEKILLDLGVHNEGNVDMNLANSIVRTAAAHGHLTVTEEFVRSYLIEGGTAVPDREEDPNHVLDEDEGGEQPSYVATVDNIRARLMVLHGEKATEEDIATMSESIYQTFVTEGFHTFTDAMLKELI